jgi:hypothetical protein
MTQSLTRWPIDDLRKLADAEGLHVTPVREDGVTYGTPTWISSVVVDGELYARAYNGKKSRWYQAGMRRRAGRIMAAGMISDVRFEPVDGPVNDHIDDAYRAKYRGSSYRHDPRTGAGSDGPDCAAQQNLVTEDVDPHDQSYQTRCLSALTTSANAAEDWRRLG